MFRKICKVEHTNQRRLRRWLAWSTLINYVIVISYTVIARSDSYWEFMSGAILLAYNYLLVRLFVSIPKRTLVMKKHGYLIVPLVTSVFISCFIVISNFIR